MGTFGATGQIIKPAAGGKTDLAANRDAVWGRRIGVEVAGWLHRASKRGAREVCIYGESKEAIMYVCERISALLGEGGKPIVVFDGDRSYEAKQATQEKRAKKREEALRMVRTLRGGGA